MRLPCYKEVVTKNMYMFASKHVQDWIQTCTCLEKGNLLFLLIYGQ